ncbi:MAG: hypothetical protein NTX25_20200 [Proteobacteria bacterium]|nr:hypothetical protein [Pseudomonadota bacterium]
MSGLALDDFGYRRSAKNLSLNYGADGQLESSVGPTGLFRYIHDAKGQRIARFKNGILDMIFAGDLVIRDGKIFQRLKVQGILLGIIEQGQFRPVYTDSRGTPFFAEQEGLKVAGAYGEAKLETDQEILNFAGFGKDKELGWVRFGVRDYDPASGLFTSPDSLFFENPDLCIESPVECNLYSYGRNNPLKYSDPTGFLSFDTITPAERIQIRGYEAQVQQGQLLGAATAVGVGGAIYGGAVGFAAATSPTAVAAIGAAGVEIAGATGAAASYISSRGSALMSSAANFASSAGNALMSAGQSTYQRASLFESGFQQKLESSAAVSAISGTLGLIGESGPQESISNPMDLRLTIVGAIKDTDKVIGNIDGFLRDVNAGQLMKDIFGSHESRLVPEHIGGRR